MGSRSSPPSPHSSRHFTGKVNIFTLVVFDLESDLLHSSMNCQWFQRLFFPKEHKKHPVLVVFLNVLVSIQALQTAGEYNHNGDKHHN